MISSQVIVACRGAKRWFDLDAVRTEHIGGPHAVGSAMVSGQPRGTTGGESNPAGAPPLDWHLDGLTTTGITLAEPPADGHIDDLALPRKIIDCMCPRQVCRVCGVARERVTGQTDERYAEVAAEAKRIGLERAGSGFGYAKGNKAQSLIQNGVVKPTIETLGWTDCGHDNYRPGVVFDPFHNPAIEAACAELGRTYITIGPANDMETTTLIVACRGAKRWFDLDAVRTEYTPETLKAHAKTTPVGDKATRQMPGNFLTHAGAPPLDWHLDGHTTSPPFEKREGTLSLRYIVGDTRDVTATIADGSIDLVFTSTPFLALRSYLPADHPMKHLEIGSEANPAAFLDVLLALTAEWGRVLAPHGTLAVELGDTYSGSGGDQAGDNAGNGRYATPRDKPKRQLSAWPLAKSLALIPQLYAIALAYGINPLTGEPSPAGRWRVRNVIHWHRPNPPVGALGDKWRPASSAITVACRGQKRWFDLDAVRQPLADSPGNRYARPPSDHAIGTGKGKGYGDAPVAAVDYSAGAPPLDWHTDGDLGVGHIVLSTQPYAGSHYATFPMDLPRKIIDCMCPRQVCRVCGVARERVVGEVTYAPETRQTRNVFRTMAEADKVEGLRPQNASSMTRQAETLGWTDCGHDNYRPGIVLDPFVGSGTTLAAAQDLGRDAIGVDLDPRNADLARERCGMFLTVEECTALTPVADPVL